MIYNAKPGMIVIISIVILLLFQFVIGPFVQQSFYKIEMSRNESSYNAFVEDFEQIKNNDTTCVDFANVTEFEWGRMYVFGPYTTADTINETLEKNWYLAEFSSIAENDSITLILFTKTQKVIAFMEIPRSVADFSPLSGEVYNSDNACFSVNEAGKIVAREKP